MEKQIEINKEQVAFCGLYCAACRQYLKGSCPGCLKNEKAQWCKVRSCCLEKGYSSCADCTTNVADCKKFSNFVSKMFAFFFNSDRKACIERIKTVGREEYAKEMAGMRLQTLRKR